MKKSENYKHSEEEYRKLINELEVHEAELEMQNEELRRVQGELEKAKDRYTDLYDFSPVGYITTNLKGIIEESNFTASNMLHTARQHLTGNPFTKFINREDQDIFYKLKQFILETGKQGSSDIRLEGENERFFHGRIEMTTDKTAEGEYTGFRIVISDISALKAAEEEAANAALELRTRMTIYNKRLRSLALELSNAEQRERNRIAAVLHDNLQQLLVGIKLNTQMALGSTADKAPEVLKRISELVDDSIKVSKSLVLELSPPVLHEGGLVPAVNWLGIWMKEKFNLAVDVRADIDVKPDREGLYLQLFEFIRELLLNVVKHSGTNAAQVFIGREDGLIKIKVSDDGAGFRYDEKHTGTDTGFGLFSIRERISLLGGKISVETAPGNGSRITMLMPPGVEQDENRAKEEEAAFLKTEQAAGKPVSSGRIRVLIADDHKIVREGLSQLLSSVPDIEVTGEAEDGANAVVMVRKIRPDIVIMDINMPNMNGVEATRIITAEFPDTIVIGLSMMEEADSSKALLSAGAVDYIHKAAASEELIASVRSHARNLIQ